MRNMRIAQARFSAEQANGLAKPSNGLAVDLPGLALHKPTPEQVRLRGRKPVLQAEKLTLVVRLISNPSNQVPAVQSE